MCIVKVVWRENRFKVWVVHNRAARATITVDAEVRNSGGAGKFYHNTLQVSYTWPPKGTAKQVALYINS